MEFNKLVDSREIEYEQEFYVHDIDLVQKVTSATPTLDKKFLSMPKHTKLVLAKYPKCKHRCSCFERDAGFVLFLFLIGVHEDQPAR